MHTGEVAATSQLCLQQKNVLPEVLNKYFANKGKYQDTRKIKIRKKEMRNLALSGLRTVWTPQNKDFHALILQKYS